MSTRSRYSPGPAAGARVDKQGEQWTLVLVRDLRHPPDKVWTAITEPEHLRQWAPFDADRSLGVVGTAKLSTVGAPTPMVAESRVKRADPPRLLEFSWGTQDLRWELEAIDGGGTRLTLWHNIEKGFIAMGAAGWHVCFDVLAFFLDGEPVGRIVGMEALKFEGWQRLHAEYGKQFGTHAKGVVMNAFLWVLQGLFALHTAMGAVWKFMHSEQRVPSLQALPHAVWLGLSVIELGCVVCFLVPAVRKSLGRLVPLAAGIIVAEMLLFSCVHLASGTTEHGQLVYWLVVACLCGFLVYGRAALRPIKA